jgi:hypothetical protein
MHLGEKSDCRLRLSDVFAFSCLRRLAILFRTLDIEEDG